jgi:hypothetical protein
MTKFENSWGICSSETAWAHWKECDRVGVGPVTKRVVKGGNDPSWWPWAGMWKCVRVGRGMAGQSYCVVGGCLLSLSLCRRGFQDLLTPFHCLLCNRTNPYPVTLLPIGSGYFRAIDTPTILQFSHFTPTCLWRWNRQIVPKRRHIKFGCWGITRRKHITSTSLPHRNQNPWWPII